MIINSLLDTDQYKYTMQYVVFRKFPDVEVEYAFRNRTKGTLLSFDDYKDKVMDEVWKLSKLKFKIGELNYLRRLGWFSRGYMEFLKSFQLNPDNITYFKGRDGELNIKINGTWLNTILWEVPLLAIISELHSRQVNPGLSQWQEGDNRIRKKIKLLNDYNTRIVGNVDYDYILRFADFGTRRRFTRDFQKHVIQMMKDNLISNSLVGTSNVLFAKKYNIKPIGTMAHEFIQAMQQIEGTQLRDSQKYAFQTWADIYRGDLGIALSDTLGMDVFFNDFDKYFSKLFDGARHDSGDPFIWCNKLIAHYKSMGIDPIEKTAVFSDGLNVQKMIDIHEKFSEKINVSFGIGTNLTNDCGIKPLQIVIKMTKCNGRPVAKISDSPGKQMCEDEEYLKYLGSVFNIRR